MKAIAERHGLAAGDLVQVDALSSEWTVVRISGGIVRLQNVEDPNLLTWALVREVRKLGGKKT